MSELMNEGHGGGTFRWHLLTTVSALALIASGATAASDTDRPTVWIELGGQLERVDSPQTTFSPAFFGEATPAVLAPMVDAQKAPNYGIGGEGKVAFNPSDSDWVFSAAVRYGRSNAKRHLHYQSNHPIMPFTYGGVVLGFTGTQNEFGDGQTSLKESHFILDFMAGKDVGLGLFGKKGRSVVSAGVRFAQFTASSSTILHARPTYVSGPFYTYTSPRMYRGHYAHYRINNAIVEARRSTHAVGPSVSWDASLPLVGDDPRMEVTFDWGMNAAILFGRQRTSVHHQTSGTYLSGLASRFPVTSYAHGPYDHERSRIVTIPNVGGFAGASFRYLDAKISFGYRADFFFGAMDNGIDTAKKVNIGFYGPFATISVGVGG